MASQLGSSLVWGRFGSNQKSRSLPRCRFLPHTPRPACHEVLWILLRVPLTPALCIVLAFLSRFSAFLSFPGRETQIWPPPFSVTSTLFLELQSISESNHEAPWWESLSGCSEPPGCWPDAFPCVQSCWREVCRLPFSSPFSPHCHILCTTDASVRIVPWALVAAAAAASALCTCAYVSSSGCNTLLSCVHLENSCFPFKTQLQRHLFCEVFLSVPRQLVLLSLV